MKMTIAAAAAGMAMPLLAGIYGDTPDAKHAWAVHDMNRPNPAKVEPGATLGQPPSDAVVLFDGTKESFERNWCDEKGNPSKWKLGDGDFHCAPGWVNGGAVYTRGEFGDCQLHLEFRHDAELGVVPKEGAQMHGNSGVFIMGNYEVQILESYGTNPADMKNPNYADGQAGAVYAENPPMVNPARRPGEWQSFDIVFHQPKWEGGKMVEPGSMTVFFNGVLVQDDWQMEGLTTHARRRPLAPHKTKDRLFLQDHGCVVRFRNVWIREIPPRWANVTHSERYGREADVAALRRETAAGLLAKIDAAKCGAEQALQAMEVISYSKEEPFGSACRKILDGYLAKLEAMDDKALDAAKDDVVRVKRAAEVLERNRVAPGCQFCAKVLAIAKRKGW